MPRRTSEMKIRLKKGDMVRIVAGNDRGRTGKVLKVFRKTGRVVVEGVHLIKRHTRPTQKNPKGGILEKEAPVHLSNVRKEH